MIQEYWPSFISLIVLIAIFIIEFRRRAPDISEEEKIAYVRRILVNLVPIALVLVTNAEYQFGDKTGPFKRSSVIDELYKRVPDEYKKYITEENLDMIIDTVLPKAEGLWIESPHLLNRTENSL